jgi:amidohydrolase
MKPGNIQHPTSNNQHPINDHSAIRGGSMVDLWLVMLICLTAVCGRGQNTTPTQELVRSHVAREYASLFELYKHLHSHPELSFQETQSAARVAGELRQAGCEVTAGVGKNGVVGVLRNGAGPTLLLRADMDALPVKEQTGLPYASTAMGKDSQGKDVPVMHACGHDIHMTWLVGAARVLAQLKQTWHGTLVFIGQPAEEAVGGALSMLNDGLYQRFPRPDYCFALHDDAELAAETVGYAPGYSGANVDSVDITVHGVGGHGAYPHKTKDPVVLAAEIILAMQTIVSREVQPGEPVVVTVGSIHGGTRRNIIPDEVRLQLTVRSYKEEARQQTLAAIKRIVRGQALAAGIPEDRLPEVKTTDEITPALYNDPQLTGRLVGALKGWFGEANLIRKPPSMGGEDFSEFGRTEPKVPICMLNVGGVSPEAVKESQQTGKPLPSLHSPLWAPVPEPTIKAGVTVMTAAVLELLLQPAK